MKYIVTPNSFAARDDVVVADRPAGLHDRAHARVEQDAGAVVEREEGVGCGDAARSTRSPARSTASLHESTRLT